MVRPVFPAVAPATVFFGSLPAHRVTAGQKNGSSRDPGKVEVDRQGAGKLVVAKHTTTITLLSPCIILILPPS
ncbi:hypothetical protein VCX45_22390, partial [Aeromonas caviae]|uniref:hypothetical protein n=1 Tax=Aeromonas caviae TaxID=648 RepID=UPI002B252CE1